MKQHKYVKRGVARAGRGPTGFHPLPPEGGGGIQTRLGRLGWGEGRITLS